LGLRTTQAIARPGPNVQVYGSRAGAFGRFMKIEVDVYNCALQHLIRKGDTDLFPYPFELKFFEEFADKIVIALNAQDLSSYHPMSLVESLIPKTKFGFRVAHQPYPVDTLIYTALVLKIFDDVESGRTPVDSNQAFSYRKSPGLDPLIFVPDKTFRQWLDVLRGRVFSDEFSHVIRTDISDFYQRIYRHRLENILESLSGQRAVVKKIEKFIHDWRGGQSFGIPVGGSASRLLAEAALNDTDLAIIAEGHEFTRYVDDMVIFVRKGTDPFATLAFLAKHLSANEGLSLNNQKTKILEWAEFVSVLNASSAEDDNDNEELATEKLFWATYGNEEEEKEALDALMMKDLQKELEELLAEQYWDMGSIRIVLHAMRLVQSQGVANYIRNNLTTLVPFAKDVCLLIREFVEAGIGGFENIAGDVVELLLSDRMRPLDCARAWFLELAVNRSIVFDAAQIRRLDALSGTLDIRQMHLIRWRANDVNYFRSRKTRVSEIPPWAQPSFIFGARCLPNDEYSHWIRGIKSRLQFPLAKEFADWCMDSYGRDPFAA
jgi:hypothetical protein